MGGRASIRCYLTKNIKRKAVGKITGRLEVNGKVYENTVGDAFRFETAEGCAQGAMNPIGKLQLTDSLAGTYVVNVNLVSGGTGSTDWAKFQGKWINETGSSKTIEKIVLMSSTQTPFCEKTGLSDVVPDNEGISYDWTITFSYVSGPLTDAYRYGFAEMIATGSFLVGNKIDFENTGQVSHLETAVLKSGGHGETNAHLWSATYIHAGVSITIDKIQYLYDSGTAETDYVDGDIVNKTLDDEDKLDAFVSIVHT